jgi:hypothetical protein
MPHDGLGAWIIWCGLTFGWNSLNSMNSRAKNSASKLYNAATTLTTSTLYLLSILFVSNLLVEAHASGNARQLVLGVVLYAVSSTAGSVVGQQYAIRFEREHHIKH